MVMKMWMMVRRSGNVDEKEEEEEVMTGVEGDQHLLLLQLRGFLQGVSPVFPKVQKRGSTLAFGASSLQMSIVLEGRESVS